MNKPALWLLILGIGDSLRELIVENPEEQPEYHRITAIKVAEYFGETRLNDFGPDEKVYNRVPGDRITVMCPYTLEPFTGSLDDEDF